MADDNGTIDDLPSSPCVVPTPSTPLAHSNPSTTSPLPPAISPILPSTDNIFIGEAFLPSPPSPTFLDPSPNSPILSNASGEVAVDLPQSPPILSSSGDIIVGLGSIPSQLTPEFLDPSPSSVPLDAPASDPSRSPTYPSTADVVNGDAFLPSQPSPQFLDPSSSSVSSKSASPSPSPVSPLSSVVTSVNPPTSPLLFSGSSEYSKDHVAVPTCPSPALSLSPGATDAEWGQLLGGVVSDAAEPGCNGECLNLVELDRSAAVRECEERLAALQQVIRDDSSDHIVGDSPIQSVSSTSPIVIPSTDDIDGPSNVQNASFVNAVRRETLDVLIRTFRQSVKTIPTDDVRIVTEIRGPTDSSTVPNASGSPTSPPDSVEPSSRGDLVAPPPSVSRVLHPSRLHHNSRSHRRVAFRGDASPELAHRKVDVGASPPAYFGDSPSPNPSSTSSSDGPVDDSIPPAQPRPVRGPVTVPPVDDLDDWLPEARARLARLRDGDDSTSQQQQNPAPSSGPADANPDSDDDLDSSQDLLLPDEDLLRLTAFRERWSEIFGGELSWPDFCSRCEEFAGEARDLVRQLRTRSTPGNTTNPAPPPPRRPPAGRPIPRFDPVAAKRIQGLYHHSKKRAARKLLCDNSVTYTGTVQAASDYFVSVLEEKHANMNILADDLKAHVPSGEDHELTKDLYAELTTSEVAAKLSSAANTSPGADRVEYAHLKKVDPKGTILSLVFNRCLLQKNVPPAWKEALTVLIYKKGDDADVSNFRPIALMSCIYKLLMGIFAKRITRWSIDAGILSCEQKSARPSEGCYEHTYIMKALVGQARRNKKKLNVAWLDIRNAFGSVPHATIRSTLRHIGVPASLVSFIMNAYSGASTVIRTPVGDTDPIPIAAGVKQGCPLSPILFNLCIELILRKVKDAAKKLKSGACFHYGTLVSCLAYADDLVIIARSARALQTLLDAASEGATILGFEFRPDKCASLSLTSTKQRATFVEAKDFTIQGNHLPALTQEESYRYLGVPIGLVHNIDDLPSIVPQLIRNLETINSSLLAPWQKLDAIRTFVQPCLTYALRAGNPVMQSLDEYKRTLNRVLREICSLPNRAAQSYIYAHKKAGGLSFQEPRTECDVQAIVQAVRMLSSSDEAVVAMARQELRYIVRRSTLSNPSPELIATYLSSTPDPRTSHLYYTYSSLWSRVRQACRRLRVSFHYSEENPISISADGSDRVESRLVTSFLHRLVQSRFADELMSLRDQGKVARCLATDQYANGSTWHCSGLNIRFKDWRFIHRARLNILPLNANKHKFSHNASEKCRFCDQPETLPHVLCHCRPDMVQIRNRHNRVVDRLTNAIRFGTISTDRTIRDSGLRLRPDIVVEEQDQVLIIDVTCPFDNDVDALTDAALAKIHKYEPLKQFVESTGRKCQIFPFVVGALGSWYPKNELLMTRLGMTRRYKSLFRKLCCTDAIQGSNNIYRLHLGCDDAAPVA